MPGVSRRALAGTRRWSLRRRVGASFAALAVLLAVLVAVTVVSLVDFTAKGNEVVGRWEPAVSTSQDLLADLVNQETGVRGYALSGRPEFLAPYEQYTRQQVTDLGRLRGFIHGYAGLAGRLTDLERAADTWRERTAEPLIGLVRANDPTAGVRIDSAADKGRFDRIRTAAADLVTAVRQVTRRAAEERRRAETFSVVALSVAVVLILAAGFAVWRGLHRWVLGPVDHLAGETRLVAAGEINRMIVPAGPPEFAQLGGDVETMRGRIADELAQVEVARADLARSNADLEQFAYVASHDLSEPLRKVANFCQLLERQYAPQLDDKARQYIGFAVDGAKRMQMLINDLLQISRVGRSTEGFVAVDTGLALDRALANLAPRIEQAKARVGHSELPTVLGDPTLLTSLFENLVGNAVRYRSDREPIVVVTAARSDDGWLFGVSDNGIGIDPQYAERIFAIFQRLHLRDQYGGTGIGLAMCRKIVEFHGGRIWLEPQPSAPGATFRFTLPEGRPS